MKLYHWIGIFLAILLGFFLAKFIYQPKDNGNDVVILPPISFPIVAPDTTIILKYKGKVEDLELKNKKLQNKISELNEEIRKDTSSFAHRFFCSYPDSTMAETTFSREVLLGTFRVKARAYSYFPVFGMSLPEVGFVNSEEAINNLRGQIRGDLEKEYAGKFSLGYKLGVATGVVGTAGAVYLGSKVIK